MPDIKEMTPGEILADSSVATFISELGKGIAAAQVDLDNNSIRQIEAFTTRRPDLGGRSLLDLGPVTRFLPLPIRRHQLFHAAAHGGRQQ
ncbi:MAG: hypothetical protein MH186_04305 [Marinobacter sp.]|nr:hypothetical protein [Marinobacter sp.]